MEKNHVQVFPVLQHHASFPVCRKADDLPRMPLNYDQKSIGLKENGVPERVNILRPW